jgi:hypothetical protein
VTERKLLANGKDPRTQKRLDNVARLTANANAFNALADYYLTNADERPREGTGRIMDYRE